jgi:hypothetical protein
VSLPRYAHCSLYVTCTYIRALCIWVRMRMSIPLWVIGLQYGLYYTGLLKIRIIMSPTTFNQKSSMCSTILSDRTDKGPGGPNGL